MIRIEANIPFIEPSQWAILEHSLIDLMNGSIDPVMERYVRADGSILWPTRGDFSGIDGLDDAVIGPGNFDDAGVIQGAGTVENLGACRYLQVGEDLDQVPRREL